MRVGTWIRWAALCAMMLMLAIGCGKKEGAEPAAPAQPDAEAGQGIGGEMTFFSWWTAGGEAEGLADLLNFFQKKFPGVKVINAAVAGGAGTNAKAVLKTRMMGGDPPDSFQVHGGSELIDTWVKAGLMQPITDLYQQEGWNDKFPQGLIDMVSKDGEIYAVPSNVHRGNVLWVNRSLFEAQGIPVMNMNYEAFFDACEKFKAAGVAPLALASRNKWPVTHLFESILLGVGGPIFYQELFDGQIAWTDKRVKESLEILKRMMGYVNKDHAALTWDQASGLVMQGKAAMNVMGDWAKGYFTTNGWIPDKDFGALPAPQTGGRFVVVTDTFGLPKGAPNAAAAREFLKVVGSAEGQVAFNIKKGSIPARIGVPTDAFDPIAVRTIKDFAADRLVPSCAHGSATVELFVTAINDELGIFIQNLDPEKTMNALEAAALDAGVRKAQ